MAEVDIPVSPESEFFRNIAEDMKKSDLDRIGEELSVAIDNDHKSLSDLETMRVEYNKLFSLTVEKVTDPWVNASNIKLPEIITACINYQARASLNLLPPKDIVKAFPIASTKEAEEKGERVSKHLNWQLMFDMPNFRDGFGKTLMMLPKDGCAFRKVYWDSIQQKVISDYILPQDFIVNYYTKDLETSQRFTQVLHQTENEIKIKTEQGLYINTDELLEPTSDQLDTTSRQNKDNVGESPPTPDYATPRTLYECHTFIKLKESDEIRTPYIVTLDKFTRKVVRIISRLSPVSEKPICYYVAYSFLPNPESIYGFGFGMLLLGINKTQNALINQVTDAGTLSTTIGGFVNEGSGMERGSLTFNMGEFKSVRARIDDLKKAIFPIEFKAPSSVLMDLVIFLKGYVNGLTTVTEVVQGQAAKSDTTATAAAISVEQAAKVFTANQQSVNETFKKELKLISDLNAIFLNESEYLEMITETDGKIIGEHMVIKRDDYLEPFDIRPVSDPNIISDQQRIAKSEVLALTVAQNPFLAQDPGALKIVMERRLEAVNENSQVIGKLNQIMAEAVKTFQAQQQIEQAQAQQIQEQEAEGQALQEQEQLAKQIDDEQVGLEKEEDEIRKAIQEEEQVTQ